MTKVMFGEKTGGTFKTTNQVQEEGGRRFNWDPRIRDEEKGKFTSKDLSKTTPTLSSMKKKRENRTEKGIQGERLNRLCHQGGTLETGSAKNPRGNQDTVPHRKITFSRPRV